MQTALVAKLTHQGYLHRIVNVCATNDLSIFSKDIISNNKTNFEVHIKHLKVLEKRK